MKKNKVFRFIVSGLFCLLAIQTAAAQYFETSSSIPFKQNNQHNSESADENSEQILPNTLPSQTSVVDTSVDDKKIDAVPVHSPFDFAYGKQSSQKPTEQQPYRRYSTVGNVTVETTEENPEDELIMLYMKNFSIYRTPSGKVRCSARFAVLTTLPARLVNLSYRLKWPNMETTLSFNDVDPGIENHFDYALLGDGCYNMDKQPNIVVNRCRAKGMTQRQCAAKIRWIREM